MVGEKNNIHELPKSWVWTNVGEISKKIQYGYTANSTTDPIGPKMLRITDIKEKGVDWNSVPHCKIDSKEKQKYLLGEGDLVFARTGATVGKSFLIRGKIPEAVFASYLIRIALSRHIMKEYVYDFFQSNMYWLQIRKGQIGTGQPNVNSQILSKITLPLPPIAEQLRIVVKVESLFAEGKTAREALDKVLVLLRKFRQSVLTKAFRGELIQHEPNDKPAEELLKRIEIERRNKGKLLHKGGKPNKHECKELQPLDDEGLLELPEGWKWTRLGQICHIVKDHVEPSEQPEKLYNYLSIGNVASESGNLVDFSPTPGKYIHSAKLEFTTQDLLYSKLRPYLNKVHIPNFSGVSATDLIPLRPEGGVPREYIAYYLRTQRVIEYANQRTRGIQLPRLPVEELLALPIPLAPRKETSRIIAKIKDLFFLADSVESAAKMARERTDKIDQAILTKTFRGELVPQDPSDEPASILLQRIKADIAKMRVKAEKNKRKIRTQRTFQQTLEKPSRSIQAVLKELGQATVEQVFQASGLSTSDFWNELKIEIDAGRIEQIRKGTSVFLKVKG